MTLWHGIILGELASKSNSRKIVRFGKRMAVIKSDKARNWLQNAGYQIKKPKELIVEDVELEAHIYYASRRPDLDESLLMDALQEFGVIKNDRQIRRKIIHGYVDRENPRCEVFVRRLL